MYYLTAIDCNIGSVPVRRSVNATTVAIRDIAYHLTPFQIVISVQIDTSTIVIRSGVVQYSAVGHVGIGGIDTTAIISAFIS